MPKKNLIQDLTRLSQRAIIRHTIDTYPNDWIVAHEVLQNALDAIYRSGKKEGSIELKMDLDKEEVEVWDNGMGFPFDLNLLGFGGSNKPAEEWKLGGEIGVGLKVVIFSTKNFNLESIFINPEKGIIQKWRCQISDGCNYLKELTDDVSVEYDDPIDLRTGETYTDIKFNFPKEDKRLFDFVKNIYEEYDGLIHDDLADTPLKKFKLALEHYFRTRGYAANVNNLLHVEQTVPTTINLSISCKEPKFPNEGLNELFQENPKISVKFKNSFWDPEEAIERTRKGGSRPAVLKIPFPEDGGYIGDYSTNYVYIQKFTDWLTFKKLLSNPQTRHPPDMSEYQPYFDSYIFGAYLVVGSREVLRKYLVGIPRMHFIAAAGVPSTHDINVPRDVGGLGFVNNIHFFC